MAVWQIFKLSRKTFFNPSGWIDAENLKNSTQAVWGILKDTTSTESPTRSESYKTALHRLKVSDAQVQKRGNTFFIYALLLAALGFICLLFSFYLLFYHTVHGFIIGVAASALFFGQAFRFHFWHFQIKHRRLGCTIHEWRTGKIHREHPHD